MKLKTHKMTVKKMKVTGAKGRKKKFMTVYCGQDHFNSRDTGKISRKKRRGKALVKVDAKNVRRLMPYA
jgi:ribosomal protein L35